MPDMEVNVHVLYIAERYLNTSTDLLINGWSIKHAN